MSIIILCLITFAYAPYAAIAYGDKLQEIVLMNLQLGKFQVWVKMVYTSVLAFSVGMYTMPVYDIMFNTRKNIINTAVPPLNQS